MPARPFARRSVKNSTQACGCSTCDAPMTASWRMARTWTASAALTGGARPRGCRPARRAGSPAELAATVRAACLAMVSTIPWRRPSPHSKSPSAPPGCGVGRRLLRPRRRHRGLPLGQDLVGRLAVDRRVVLGADRAARAHRGPLFRRDRAHAAARRADQRPLDRHRHALLLQRRDQRLADARAAEITSATLSFGLATNVSAAVLHRLLIARREGAQRVLDAVAELAEDLVRHVVGKLRDRSRRRRPWTG